MTEEIAKLSDYQHIRKRVFMYFGSPNATTQTTVSYKDNKVISKELTWNPAIYTAFREILDNALDEVIGHGYGNKIYVNYDKNNFEFTVQDNGRGIPITFNKEENKHIATLALTEARTGRNFGDRSQVAGTNGIGASATVFTSQYTKIEIKRDKKRFTQEFKEGHSILSDDLQISEPKIADYSGFETGTKITFKPSKQVFEKNLKLENNMLLPEEFIKSRMFEVAICNPKVKFYYNDELIKVKLKVEQNLFEDPIVIDVKQNNFNSTFYLQPNWGSEGEFVHSIVNNIPAFNGGSHIDSFKRIFYKNLLLALAKESKRRKLIPNNSDIQAGLLVYNITKMDAPNFDSQSKTRLINEEAGTIVKKFLEDEELYKTIIKKNKIWIEQIYERCSERTQKKDSSEIDKLSKKISRNKIPGLMEANGKDRSKCILTIAEGESALGGISSVRNPEIHAGYGLRGKILNVYDESIVNILENKVLSDLMNSIGLKINQKADRKILRYGQIWLGVDQDPDGASILSLLINFFYKFWPELFDVNQDPYFYAFLTPFIIAEKGKERKYWYNYDINDFKPEDYKGWIITRAKGLGSLMSEDWKNALNEPKLVGFKDSNEELKDLLTLLFHPKLSDKRKDWLAI